MFKKIAIILCLLFMFSACASRLPSAKRSQKTIQKYFKKYGKKYPTTIYAKGVDSVDVYSTDEIQYLLVSVDALVFLKDGNAKRIEATLQRRAGGWHVVSWEAQD